MINKIIIKRGR